MSMGLAHFDSSAVTLAIMSLLYVAGILLAARTAIRSERQRWQRLVSWLICTAVLLAAWCWAAMPAQVDHGTLQCMDSALGTLIPNTRVPGATPPSCLLTSRLIVAASLAISIVALLIHRVVLSSPHRYQAGKI